MIYNHLATRLDYKISLLAFVTSLIYLLSKPIFGILLVPYYINLPLEVSILSSIVLYFLLVLHIVGVELNLINAIFLFSSSAAIALFNKKGLELVKKKKDTIFAATVSIILLYFSLNGQDLFSLLAVALSIIIEYIFRELDERNFVAFALLYLILAAITLALGNEKIANILAIVAYWDLVIGVLGALRNLREE
jgi:hypothetical protein